MTFLYVYRVRLEVIVRLNMSLTVGSQRHDRTAKLLMSVLT